MHLDIDRPLHNVLNQSRIRINLLVYNLKITNGIVGTIKAAFLSLLFLRPKIS